jgi:hypothetical protein
MNSATLSKLIPSTVFESGAVASKPYDGLAPLHPASSVAETCAINAARDTRAIKTTGAAARQTPSRGENASPPADALKTIGPG